MTTPTPPRSDSAVPRPTLRPAHYKDHWQPQDTMRLIAMAEERVHYRVIAKRLRRTAGGVKCEANKLNVGLYQGDGRTVRATALRLGLDQHTLASWVLRGWITSVPILSPRRETRVIRDDDLWAFLGDDRYWHEWTVERIADSELRRLVQKLRHGPTGRFYSTKEAAQRLGLVPQSLLRRITVGLQLAVRCVDGRWMIREDWIEDGRRVSQSQRRGTQYFTDEDRAFVREWRPHLTVPELATALGRESRSVQDLCRRLGVEGPLAFRGSKGRQWHRPTRLDGVT